MTPEQWKATGKQMAADVRSFVARSLSPLRERIALLATQRESADQLLADIEERLSKLERERDERKRAPE